MQLSRWSDRRSMTDVLVEINGLIKHYGSERVLNCLEFNIRQGEMVSMVGPDGAGKTTLIRTMCGLIPFQSGQVKLLGHQVPSEMHLVKPHIGYLSQRFSLYGDLSVDENIEFFAEIHGVRNFKNRRDELLDFTRMKPYRNRLADQLSGGMKQKLALACTLVHTPKIIFLDEPTTGVDPVSRRDFWKILSRLLFQGLTIFLTTPYMDEAERCSRVAMLDRGNILAMDTPVNIKNKFDSRVFEIVSPDIKRTAMIMADLVGQLNVQVFGDRLNLMIERSNDKFKSILGKLKDSDLEITSLQEVQPSLENIFIKLMNNG